MKLLDVLQEIQDAVEPQPRRSLRSRGLKAALVLGGGLAGLTAASAKVSTLRRREEAARDDS